MISSGIAKRSGVAPRERRYRQFFRSSFWLISEKMILKIKFFTLVRDVRRCRTLLSAPHPLAICFAKGRPTPETLSVNSVESDVDEIWITKLL